MGLNIYYPTLYTLKFRMIGKRSGKYGFKKIQLVPTKVEFDSINSTRQTIHEEKKQKCEQEIIVPGYQIVQPVCPPKNTSIPSSYIKTITIRNMMSKQKYQLDSTDLCFLNNNFQSLEPKIFCDILIALEQEGQKFGTEFNYQKVLQRTLHRTNMVIDKEKKQGIFREIFTYWRNKRKNMRSPLLREFWVKNELGPFKNRQQSGVSLRNKAIKVNDEEIREILAEDLLGIKKILLLMQQREKQEKSLLQAQTAAFEKACKKVLNKIQKQNENLNNSKNSAVSSKKYKHQSEEKVKKTSKEKNDPPIVKNLRRYKSQLALHKAIYTALM